MHPLLNIATKAAKQAGDIIVRHIDQLDRIKISSKYNEEYFTEVDVKAEQAIVQMIHKAYPDHGIIAEEGGVLNEKSETVWIIDPLDGTNNFIHGFPAYAVSIAVRVKNRIEHGVVYNPLLHECFSATRGAGARLNDHRIRVSKQILLSNALLGTGFKCSQKKALETYMPSFTALTQKCAGIRRTGAAALDLAYVACGRLDGYWEYGLRLWDIAAGTLLVKEAGGFVTDIKGGDGYLDTGNIIAAPPKLIKSMLQTLRV